MIYRLGTPQGHFTTMKPTPLHILSTTVILSGRPLSPPLHRTPVNMLVQLQLRNLGVPIPRFRTIP